MQLSYAKKVCSWVLAFVAISVALFMTGCGGRDEELVGVWVWASDFRFETTFNADGSGSHTRTWGYGTRFDWTTPGNNITWNYSGHPNMRTPYRIDGNALYITMANGSVVLYYRADYRSEALVGRWVWEDNPEFVTTFNADGTGEHAISWGFGTSFEWTTPASMIRWEYPGQSSMGTPISFSGNALYIDMGGGVIYRYIRD